MNVATQIENYLLDPDTGPRSYGTLCVYRRTKLDGKDDADRMIDRTLQRLRKAGKIKAVRAARTSLWIKTSS